MKYVFRLILCSALITSCSNNKTEKVDNKANQVEMIKEHYSFDSSLIAQERELSLALLASGKKAKDIDRLVDSMSLKSERDIYQISKDSTRLKWYFEYKKRKANPISP